jgi:hypothetical protein
VQAVLLQHLSADFHNVPHGISASTRSCAFLLDTQAIPYRKMKLAAEYTETARCKGLNGEIKSPDLVRTG